MSLSYRQAQATVLGFGTALIVAVALAAFFRGADPVEVGAIVLFVPVLAGLSFGNVRGGLAVAIVVSVAYVAVRFSTLGGLETGEFVATSVTRVLLYVGLGVFGGWANEMLTSSLRKLELYDEVDDVTGVGNARALLTATDREIARSLRYHSVFALVVVAIDRDALDAVGERRARGALRDLCRAVDASVRTTDLVHRIPLPEREDITLMLPETGAEGASTLAERLDRAARERLASAGVELAEETVRILVHALPGDDSGVASYRGEVRRALGRQNLTVVEDRDVA